MNFCHKAIRDCVSLSWCSLCVSTKGGSQEPGAGPALCSHIQKKASGSGVNFNTFFFLSRCESKELDLEIRNLIGKNNALESREDPKPLAQERLSPQRTSCSLKVITVCFCNVYLPGKNTQGMFSAGLDFAWNFRISEMMQWTCYTFFFSWCSYFLVWGRVTEKIHFVVL